MASAVLARGGAAAPLQERWVEGTSRGAGGALGRGKPVIP